MRFANLIVILALTLIMACNKGDDHINKMSAVWTANDWPPQNMATPISFSISPFEAYQIAASSKRISLKHKWVCYKDQEYYYIADSFGKNADAETAVGFGLKINGTTGKIEN